MPTNYRKYNEADLETLQQLMLELGYSVEQTELRNNIEAILHGGGEILVAEENNVLVGSVCILMDARLAEGIYAEIVSLIVSGQARGKGIGTALVRAAEGWASQRVNKIRIRANETRTSAHAFYLDRGYEKIKTQKIFIKNL